MRGDLMAMGWLGVMVTAACLLVSVTARAAQGGASSLPEGWLARWRSPPAEDRPLQIVHGINPRLAARSGMDRMVPGRGADRVAPAGMQTYSNLGLGGIVCNVAFTDYMRSEENFQVLVDGVEACRRLGLVVWLYDEEGYPSGSAGGLVLRENPAFEATELAFDAGRADPFIIRPAYEFTHASNNYHAARRYVNLLDDRATRAFIAQTHEVYWRRLQAHFGKTIQAMFTDEPSLIAVNLGQIPENARKRVPVVDRLDPSVRPLPAVPWGYDLAEQYRKRYGQDLMSQRRSLFVGDADEDRTVRRQFWGLVADLVADRYFGALQDWCGRHGIASSGHTLWEESVMHHPALEGNALKVLGRMDIPGLDVLSSDPEAVLYEGWLAAALPSSAAMLTGRRRVMTEVSDFSQKMGGQGPVGLPQMQSSAAWQAAWGVTDFTLYYAISDRSPEAYRAYGDYVGRLNAVLKPARPAPEVLLYYPVADLWSEYRPVAEPLHLESQTPRAQRLVCSFLRLGRALSRSQIPFAVADHDFLSAATVGADGRLSIKDCVFRTVVIPEGAEAPAPAARVLDEFRRMGGRVLTDGPDAAKLAVTALADTFLAAPRIEPASDRVVLGRFQRDGWHILFLANVGRAPYDGRLTVEAGGTWYALDPGTGAIEPAQAAGPGALRLALAPRQAVLLASGPRPK
jgi:hypothetical protein